MGGSEKVPRASAQRRRNALIGAASELVAEVGAGAVTHRAVAKRAGVPLSTTSYFFASIEDLVTEALVAGASDRVLDIDARARAAVSLRSRQVDEVIAIAVDEALSVAKHTEGGQIEFFLASGRQPQLRDQASASVRDTVNNVADQIGRTGAVRAEEAAWAVAALGDGAMLHRWADIDTDHRARLTSGLRLLIAAAMLRDDEIEELLSRYSHEPNHLSASNGATATID